MGMVELNPQNRSKRLPRIFAWTFLSLLFVGVIFVLKEEFRWGQSAGGAGPAVAGMPKDEFERRVHDYLLAHPEVISEAINRLEAQQRQQEAARGKAALNHTLTKSFAIRPIRLAAIRMGTLHWSSSLITTVPIASRWLRSSRKQKNPTRNCALSTKSIRYWGPVR
jgi:hypothetical protein